MLVALNRNGICAIALGSDRDKLIHDLLIGNPKAELLHNNAIDGIAEEVVTSIDNPSAKLNLPLDLRGTEFQLQVWRALQDIPCGVTVSYSELARRIGSAQSFRAVGAACAANRLAVVVPCHRAVRLDGSLAGYRWGIDIKAELLRREKQLATTPEAQFSQINHRPVLT